MKTSTRVNKMFETFSKYFVMDNGKNSNILFFGTREKCLELMDSSLNDDNEMYLLPFYSSKSSKRLNESLASLINSELEFGDDHNQRETILYFTDGSSAVISTFWLNRN